MRIALLLALVPACGYTAGPVASGEGVRLAVPVFLNQTFRRELDRDLTRFVREELLARTRYSLVEPGAADLVLRGRILDVSEDVLAQRSKGRIRETSVSFTVSIEIEDRRAGAPPGERVRLVERRAYAPEKGESIRTAEVAAMRRLAERIVYSLSPDW